MNIANSLCNHIQQILNDEMKQKLFPLYNLGKNKPYWDGELQTLWDTMHNDEKSYIRYKDKKQRNYYSTKFYKSRQIVDKKLRCKERTFKNKLISDLENTSFMNSKMFRTKIKKIGPWKLVKVPLTVEINGNLSSNLQTVCNKWQSDFHELYNCRIDSAISTQLHELILTRFYLREKSVT